jgi:integrase
VDTKHEGIQIIRASEIGATANPAVLVSLQPSALCLTDTAKVVNFPNPTASPVRYELHIARASNAGSILSATPSSTGKRGIVPKRRFQTGTFVKRGDNWIGMWRVDAIQPDGTVRREQRSRTFVDLSERAARQQFQPILDAVNAASGASTPIPRGADTLKRLIAEWRQQVAGTLKPSSLRAANSHLRRIEPPLGELALSELTVKKVQAFVTSLSTGSRTRKTIENILLTLSSILSSGRKWGYAIPQISISDLSLPQGTPKEGRFFEFNQVRKIIRAADEPLSTICFVLSVTGLRIGEALALRVEDLDFQRKLVKVRGSVYAGQIGTPKSKASIADLPMPAALETRLKTYLASKHFWSNALGLLFINRRGLPYSANKLREKKLRPLLTKLGIPLAGFHAFRHAVATELIDSGAPITVVQAQLRHSDARITLGLYGHVIPQSQRDAVSSLAARLGGQLLTDAGIADSAA